MKEYKVSVIIPVYRVRDFIEKSLHALFRQTLTEIEYIFVDDAGDDGSMEIAEEILRQYPERNKDVRIIRHNENKGVSVSRQEGLSAAAGEYVIHCDTDDEPETDMYELMYERAVNEDADVVICDFKEVRTGREPVIFRQKPAELTAESVLRQFSENGNENLIGSLWNKLIRREVAQKGEFTPKINYCEDVLYLFRVLSSGPVRIAYLDKALYRYLKRSESLTTISGKRAVESDFILYENLETLAQQRAGKTAEYARRFIGRTIRDRLFKYELDGCDLSRLRKYKETLTPDLFTSKMKMIKVKGGLLINFTIFKWINTNVPKLRKIWF